MQYELARNCRNITIKAALLVAFFVSCVAAADIWTDGTIDIQAPKVEQFCVITSTGNGAAFLIGERTFGQTCTVDADAACQQIVVDIPQNGTQTWTDNTGGEIDRVSNTAFKLICSYDSHRWNNGSWITSRNYKAPINVGGQNQDLGTCPPDSYPTHTAPKSDDDGNVTGCYIPKQYQDYLDSLSDNAEADTYCNTLALDSGNNTTGSMCYTAYNGFACEVQRVTQGDYSYYQGVKSNPLGCSESQNPPFDAEGIGDINDSCITHQNRNFCDANRDNHCSDDQYGIEQCDTGCIQINDKFMCDPAMHPDVGEGESNYFDSNGTCSVVAGSSYRGMCEELGGTWSKEGDYTKTSCPATSIAGSCSVGTNGGCFACLDAGGTWTPDENAPLTNTEKGIQDVAALTQQTNDVLTTLENTTRKTGESLVSTIKSGNAKVVAELKNIASKAANGGEQPEEKESFSVNTGNIDKSKFEGLFGANDINKLNTEIDTLKAELQTELSNIRSEGASLMNITVPNASGYQARSVTLTHGTFDVSLSRFSDFFKMLAPAILLLCACMAAFILLGSKQ